MSTKKQSRRSTLGAPASKSGALACLFGILLTGCALESVDDALARTYRLNVATDEFPIHTPRTVLLRQYGPPSTYTGPFSKENRLVGSVASAEDIAHVGAAILSERTGAEIVKVDVFGFRGEENEGKDRPRSFDSSMYAGYDEEDRLVGTWGW